MKRLFTLLAIATLLISSCVKDPEIPKDILITSISITASHSNVASTTATISGTCSALSKMSSVIVHYGTSNPPEKASIPNISGDTYNVMLTGLFPGLTYYYYVEATGGGKTSYSNNASFTTKLEGSDMPTVYTNSITDITSYEAVGGGNVTSDGGSAVYARGVVWGYSQDPTLDSGNYTSDGTGSGNFTSYITGLNPNTRYYVRAYATNTFGTSYGDNTWFITNSDGEIVIPTVTTAGISSITTNSAVSGGNVTSDGGSAVTARGVVWSTSQTPTLDSGTYTYEGDGIGSFTSNLSGLTANTTYYVRAYATNSAGTGYGEEKSFTTNQEEEVVWSLIGAINGSDWDVDFPLTEISAGVWDSEKVTVNGGFKIRKNHDWTISYGGNFVNYDEPFAAIQDGDNITPTDAGIDCIVRFNTNDYTITVMLGEKPTVSTSGVTSVTTTTAVCGGNITSEGDNSVTARGVVWSTSSNPTIDLETKTSDGTGAGEFTSSITGLAAGTTYYVRAYATNSVGTAYGQTEIFTTKGTCGGNEDLDTDDKHRW